MEANKEFDNALKEVVLETIGEDNEDQMYQLYKFQITNELDRIHQYFKIRYQEYTERQKQLSNLKNQSKDDTFETETNH